jgi:hypothetical protein
MNIFIWLPLSWQCHTLTCQAMRQASHMKRLCIAVAKELFLHHLPIFLVWFLAQNNEIFVGDILVEFIDFKE